MFSRIELKCHLMQFLHVYLLVLKKKPSLSLNQSLSRDIIQGCYGFESRKVAGKDFFPHKAY